MLDVPDDLAALPISRSRALLLAWYPDVGLREIGAVVEADPAFTASVLRAANSASSAPRGPITDPQQAVIRIGLEESKKIIVSSVMSSAFDRLDDSGIDLDTLWRHLLAVALLAEEAATTQEDRTAAFTAGMLHDLGRIALAARSPSRYWEVVRMVEAGADTEDAERAQFGTTHTDWGGRVGEAWRLPSEVIEVIFGHHHPEGEGLTRAVYNGREASKWIGDGVVCPQPCDQELTPEQQAALDGLGGRQGLLAHLREFSQAIEPR